MIAWCAYCQTFQGERAPFEEYGLTHGQCSECATLGLEIPATRFAAMERLKDIQNSLFAAGETGDALSAKRTIFLAAQRGVRPVELLMGAITPTLWKVGKLWEQGKITETDEHRFTAFYEEIISGMPREEVAPVTGALDVLLMNAPGNSHTLGIKVLHLWLQSRGLRSAVISGENNPEDVASEVKNAAPLFLGISAALPEQLAGAEDFADRIYAQLPSDHTEIVMGGYAVKVGGNVVRRRHFRDGLAFLEAALLRKARRRHVANF